jgi:hypothetical protein
MVVILFKTYKTIQDCATNIRQNPRPGGLIAPMVRCAKISAEFIATTTPAKISLTLTDLH